MRYRVMTVFSIVVVIATGLQISPASAASTYYVAPNGDDSNPGTEARPFRTINRGVSVLGPGDTLYVRGGAYHERVVISNPGTAGNPITVSAYPGENPVIDGQNNLPSGWGGLVSINGDYIVFTGFEVRHSAYLGVRVGGNYSEAHDLYVHHSRENGILVQGNHNLVEGCDVWWNATSNEYGQSSRWAGGLNAARHPSYAVIRNNVVRQNWGEGLSAFEADHVTMEDNVVYDNWTTNVYISDVTDIVFQRNLVYGVPGSVVDQTADNTPCIGLADEVSTPDSRNVTIVNNMVMNCHWNFYWWRHVSSTGLKDSLIAHNTFVNSTRFDNFRIDTGNHINTRIENNIVLQDSGSIASVPNDPDLNFSHNLWSRTPPASASSPNDVIGNPQLAQAGPIGPGLLTPEWFKLLASSPARDRARVIAEITEDFFRNARVDSPDIGAHEYVGPSESPTPTNTPTPTPTSTPLPTNTPTATNTPLPTYTPTLTSTATPTSAPTNTPTLTNTPTPTATNTPPLPTSTPTRKTVQVFLPLISKGWNQDD